MTPFVRRFSNKLCQLFIIPNIMNINFTITNIWTEVMLVSGWIYDQNTASVPAHAYSASNTERPVAGELSGTERDLGAGQGRKVRDNGCVISQKTQELGSGRREEWQRLAGGECRRRLGERHYALGKEVDSSCYIDVLWWWPLLVRVGSREEEIKHPIKGLRQLGQGDIIICNQSNTVAIPEQCWNFTTS